MIGNLGNGPPTNTRLFAMILYVTHISIIAIAIIEIRIESKPLR